MNKATEDIIYQDWFSIMMTRGSGDHIALPAIAKTHGVTIEEVQKVVTDRLKSLAKEKN